MSTNKPLTEYSNGQTYIVSIGRTYGNTHYYPACHISKQFAILANDKTLTTNTLDIMKKLGYKLGKIIDLHATLTNPLDRYK